MLNFCMPPWPTLLLASICALCAIASTVLTVMQGRRLRRIEGAVNQGQALQRDHRREFLAFALEQGWNDNMKLTQRIDTERLSGMFGRK